MFASGHGLLHGLSNAHAPPGDLRSFSCVEGWLPSSHGLEVVPHGAMAGGGGSTCGGGGGGGGGQAAPLQVAGGGALHAVVSGAHV